MAQVEPLRRHFGRQGRDHLSVHPDAKPPTNRAPTTIDPIAHPAAQPFALIDAAIAALQARAITKMPTLASAINAPPSIATASVSRGWVRQGLKGWRVRAVVMGGGDLVAQYSNFNEPSTNGPNQSLN